MIIKINEKEHHVPSGLSIEAILRHCRINLESCVVLHNGEIIEKTQYQSIVMENDTFTLLSFVGGG